MAGPATEPTFAGYNDSEMRRAGVGLAVIVLALWSPTHASGCVPLLSLATFF